MMAFLANSNVNLTQVRVIWVEATSIDWYLGKPLEHFLD